MRLTTRRAYPRLLHLLAGLVVMTSATSKAYALEVGLETSGCADLSEARVRELAALELTTRVVEPQTAQRLGAMVLVACHGEEVSIRVTDSLLGKVVTRTFTLKEADRDVRARAIALAAAELVLTSWLELMLPRPARNRGLASQTEDRRAASAIAHQRTNRGARVDALLAFAEVGGTFRAAPWTRGAGLRVSIALGEPALAIDADASATLASNRTDLGIVRVNTWSLALRPALRWQRGLWLGTAGVGARVGLARIEGSPTSPDAARGSSLVGTWGGPLVHANAGVAFGHFASRLGGELGYSVRGVSGSVDGRDRAGVRGAWVLVSLGFGWGT